MKILNPNINFSQFFLDLSAGKAALLILDYDGTLAPFAQNPEEAVPYPGVSAKIEQIMQLTHTKVIVLSGRTLTGLRTLLNIEPPPELWGSHGGERLRIGQTQTIVQQEEPVIKNLLAKAANDAKQLAPELYCEIKPLAVALHWRGKNSMMAKEQSGRVLTQWKKNLGKHALEIHEFDGGLELRPKGINKGEAIKTVLKEIPTDTLIAYLGDDFSDEEAFEILRERALKILVRQIFRPSKADVQLIPPEELLWFFDQWLQHSQRASS